MERLLQALGGNQSANDDPFAGMSPVDALRLRMELAERQKVSPEQRAANLRQTVEEGLGIVPVIGNALAAKDAYQSGRAAADAFGQGDWKGGALNSAAAGLSGVGAVVGLPFGKLAKSVAEDGGRTLRSGLAFDRSKPIHTLNDVHKSSLKYQDILDEMKGRGAPDIEVVDMGPYYMALEGSHRLHAAEDLGLTPNVSVRGRDDALRVSDYDWSHLPYVHEDGLTAGDIAEMLMEGSQGGKILFK